LISLPLSRCISHADAAICRFSPLDYFHAAALFSLIFSALFH